MSVPRMVSFFATTDIDGRDERVLTPAVAWGVWAVHAVAHESRVHVTGWREAVPGPRLYVADGRVVCAPPGRGVALDDIAVEHMPPGEWAVSHMPLGLRAATGPLAADACALAARLADGWPNWCSDARRVTASDVANLRALLAEVQPGALAGIEGLGATIRAAQGMTPGTPGAPGRLRARLL